MLEHVEVSGEGSRYQRTRLTGKPLDTEVISDVNQLVRVLCSMGYPSSKTSLYGVAARKVAPTAIRTDPTPLGMIAFTKCPRRRSKIFECFPLFLAHC
jgi:hypothetical protein